jgi:diguanylate cyclase (GGDEF)-like protein/PAS domain S-box-containing protein
MDIQPPATSVRRRSERVSIAFPLEIAGTDLGGHHFTDRTSTTTVSRYGCCVTVPRMLQKNQPLYLRRIGMNETIMGRVVAPMGVLSDGRAYGVGTADSCENLWGIRFSSAFYEKLLDVMYDGVYYVNQARTITYWNAGAERLTGYSGHETVGKRCFENLLGHVDENGRPLCGGGCPLSQVLSDGMPYDAQIYLRHKEGHRVPIHVRVLPMTDAAGSVVGAVEVFSDATEKRTTEKRVRELEQIAFVDSLTGLPNRRFVELKVTQAWEEHQRFGRMYGLLMLDLDRFKSVNDSYGHEAGDALLKVVARTLAHSQRPADIVGRWGGEEFLVLMPDLTAVELGDLAERCRVLIAHSSVINGGARISTTTSIGATVFHAEESAQATIRRVDELMYESKRSGGDRTTAG